MFEVIINVLVAISALIVGVLPLFFEIRTPIKYKPNKKVFTREGKVFLFFVVVALITSIEKIYLDLNSSKIINENLNSLTISHATDSMQQIVRDLSCKRDAEINEYKNQKALDHLRDSIRILMVTTENSINYKSDNNTNKILSNAKHLDSAKIKSEPFITYASGVEPVIAIQTHDSLYINVTFSNTG